MKIVDINNQEIIDSQDLMKIFKERQLAVKISNEREYNTFIKMAKEAGFDIPEGLCFEHIKERPCLHLSKLFENQLFCDFVEYCEAPENPYTFRGFVMRPYKVVSYDEFIQMGCGSSAYINAEGRGYGKGMSIRKTFLDEPPLTFEMESVKKPSFDFGKLLHQHLVDINMNDPYDIHISSDGKTTTARFYVNGKLVRTAEANCHPDDRFNFKTGAEVAFDRLFEKQRKEKNAKVDLNNPKPGDKVRVRRDLEAGRGYGGVMVNGRMQHLAGKIVTISHVETKTSLTYVGRGVCMHILEDNESWVWTPEMFEVM